MTTAQYENTISYYSEVIVNAYNGGNTPGCTIDTLLTFNNWYELMLRYNAGQSTITSTQYNQLVSNLNQLVPTNPGNTVSQDVVLP